MIGKLRYGILTLLLLISINSFCQIYINELCSRNGAIVTDEDGDNPDWIELYNAGATGVNIGGYFLSDDTLIYNKWIIPNYTIAAGSYLTVFASSKDKTEIIDHWEALVLGSNNWKYIVPLVDPGAWRQIGYDDSMWLTGAGLGQP